MQIKSSTTLRNNYSAISKLAKETQEPIYITVNGEGDGVFMDIDAYERQEAIIRLRTLILEREQELRQGGKTYSLDEVRQMLKESLGHAKD